MKLGKKDLSVVSVMLFALFFGAGNLIFPPFLGQKAGDQTLPAMLGFLATAVILPVLGVVVVARFDGLEKLGQQVGRRFALVFTVLIYLSIGPGLGLGTGPEAVLTAVLTHAACPVVIDADGITLLVRHMDILRGRMAPTILTPHDGEFARLFGPVGEDRMASARAAALDSRSIVLLKGHRTCITDGTRDYRNTTGNPGMATGGSGDVLAGILASLLGQGLEPLEAAACAAWLHGKAGDLCAEDLGEYGMLPTDLLGYLPRLLK